MKLQFINFKAITAILISVAIFTLFHASPILAGGFNVELTAENVGLAGHEGVGIEIYTGTKDRATAFNTGYEFRLTFLNSAPGQKCVMDKPTSNNKGLAHGICYSDIAGYFTVYPEVHNFMSGEEWSSLDSEVKTTVQFTKKLLVNLSPLPTKYLQNTDVLEKKVDDLQKNDTEIGEKTSSDSDKKIEELEQKTKQLEEQLKDQQKEVSVLKRIVTKIVDLLSSLWPFKK